MPIPETQRTVAPGDATYGTRKVALEQELLAAGDRLPTTLLRAGAIHGPHCRTPRELYFVKRALDGRPVRVLAHGGREPVPPGACVQCRRADPARGPAAGLTGAQRG